MAYGQTGAGKTFTIDGLIKMIAKQAFSYDGQVACSYYQIYNERIYDLFTSRKGIRGMGKDLKIKLASDGNYAVDGLTAVEFSSQDELIKQYLKASK